MLLMVTLRVLFVNSLSQLIQNLRWGIRVQYLYVLYGVFIEHLAILSYFFVNVAELLLLCG